MMTYPKPYLQPQSLNAVAHYVTVVVQMLMGIRVYGIPIGSLVVPFWDYLIGS